jgi:D-alanine--poly(phosphoribitol) ligase subunit 1
MRGIDPERLHRKPDPDLVGKTLAAPDLVLDLIAPHWTADAERTAVSGPDGDLTYRELDRTSAGIAAALLEKGASPGEPVLVHTGASSRAISALLGILRAGGRFVAIDVAFPPERQERMAAASGARLALVGSDAGVTAAEPLPIDDIKPADTFTEPRPQGSAPAYTCFTSGSTGTPKGVVISHRALSASTAARQRHYPDTVTGFVLCSSLSFDSAYAGIFWTLASGGTLIVPSSRAGDLSAVGRAATDARASHLLMVPSLYAAALRGGLAPRLTGLKTVIVAGESCPPDLVRRHFGLLPDVTLHNEYGPTECAVWSTVHRCTPEDAVGPGVPIGKPIPGARLRVRTPAGDPVPLGGTGELWVAGPGVALGYDSDDADAEKFAVIGGDRCYRTGDLVSVRSDGELDFHGRADRQLKLGGMRIEIEEIEAALTDCPGVAAAGIGVSVRAGRTTLVAAVVPEGADVPTATLRTHLMRRVPAGAVPVAFAAMTGLPRQPNGKLDRAELDRFAEERVTSADASGPSPGGP